MRVFDYIIIDPTNQNGITVTVKSQWFYDYLTKKGMTTEWLDYTYKGNYNEVCRFKTSLGSFPLVAMRTAINERIKHAGLVANSNNQDEVFNRWSIPNMVFMADPKIKNGIDFTYEKPVTKGELGLFVKALEYYFTQFAKAVNKYFRRQLQTVIDPTSQNGYLVNHEVITQ